MNIPYAATIVRAVIDGETVSSHLTDLKDQLVNAGWTATNVGASQIGTFTGTAGNNQTVTIDGVVYTFKTTLTPTAYEVLIGANAAASANNLARAINDSGTAGTHYGTGTAAHPTVTASDNGAGVITLTAATAGTAGNGIVLAETITNFTWAAANLWGGGFNLVSANDHPCKYRVMLYIRATGATTFQYRVSPEFTTQNADYAWLTVSAGRSYLIRATPYDVWILRPATQEFFYAGALWNPEEWAPKTVTAITAGSTTTLSITAHGFNTGDQVTLSQFAGDANWIALNGRSFACTVVDANTITIPIDTTSYATGTAGFAGNKYQIGLSLLACGSLSNAGGTNGGTFRTNLAHSDGFNAFGRCWTAFNESFATSAGFSNTGGNVRILPIATSTATTFGMPVGLTNHFMYIPAMISHGITNHGNSNGNFVGCMWNAVAWLGTQAVTNDLDQIPLDGRFFYNITDRSGSPTRWANGCLFIEVPEVSP